MSVDDLLQLFEGDAQFLGKLLEVPHREIFVELGQQTRCARLFRRGSSGDDLELDERGIPGA